MITHIQDYQYSSIPYSDVCIVGAGAAGMDLAWHLSRHTNYSITLLESGYETFDWKTQTLYDFKQSGLPIRSANHSHAFGLAIAKRRECRLRQFGGTLNIWGERWKVLDPFDFEHKSYISMSGWPITYEDLLPYYHSVAKDFGVEEILLYNERSAKIPISLALLSSFQSTINLKIISKRSIHLLQKAITSSPAINIILGANVVDIELTENLSHVCSLFLRSLNGWNGRISAKYFILACGTIENTRLLLCANKQIPEGVGNKKNLVGRYLMDHPSYGKLGKFTLFDQRKFPEAYSHSDGYEKTINFEFSLSSELLKKWELPHHCIRIKKSSGSSDYEVKFFLEQLPNNESRISLTKDVDALKMPSVNIEWKFKEQDYLSFRRFAEKINEAFISHQIGCMSLDDDFFDMKVFQDHSHQMGTTRMGTSPKTGVVDPQCQVFGIDNLFLSGSSVFPSAGNANPTFTIFALARRLGDYLKSLS